MKKHIIQLVLAVILPLNMLAQNRPVTGTVLLNGKEIPAEYTLYNSGTVLLLHYLLPRFWLMHFLRLIPNLMERGLSYQFKRVGILQSVVVASHDVPHSNVKLQLI